MDMPNWVASVDPCDADCPSRDLLDLIGARWSLLIMLVIGQGFHRQKMLTQTLRALEANGLVARHDFATVPPHVEYRLTPLGVSLGHAVGPMFQWIEASYPAVLRARAAYAARQAQAA